MATRGRHGSRGFLQTLVPGALLQNADVTIERWSAYGWTENDLKHARSVMEGVAYALRNRNQWTEDAIERLKAFAAKYQPTSEEQEAADAFWASYTGAPSQAHLPWHRPRRGRGQLRLRPPRRERQQRQRLRWRERRGRSRSWGGLPADNYISSFCLSLFREPQGPRPALAPCGVTAPVFSYACRTRPRLPMWRHSHHVYFISSPGR